MNLKRIGGALAAMLLLSLAEVIAADLRVTDSTNTAITVQEAYVDYGGFSTDRETEGIRIHQGEATVVAKWTNIQMVTFTGREGPENQQRLKVEILLKSGARVSASLVTKGRMKLAGKTELGDYVIDLEKVRTIAPVS